MESMYNACIFNLVLNGQETILLLLEVEEENAKCILLEIC